MDITYSSASQQTYLTIWTLHTVVFHNKHTLQYGHYIQYYFTIDIPNNMDITYSSASQQTYLTIWTLHTVVFHNKHTSQYGHYIQ